MPMQLPKIEVFRLNKFLRLKKLLVLVIGNMICPHIETFLLTLNNGTYEKTKTEKPI